MSVTANPPQPAVESTVAEDEEQFPEEERRQRQIERNQGLIALLDSWIEEDLASGEDDSEALEEFMSAIDANRIPGSKLFS